MPIPMAVLALSASLFAPVHHHNPAAPCGHPVTAKASRPFEHRVWDERRWQRGSPHSPAIKAWHHKLHCAGPRNRRTMQRDWQRDKLRYGRYRELRQIAPYPGFAGRGLAERWLAIPRYIVECESGGDWFAVNPSGAAYLYQLNGWGAPYPDTWRAKMANHRIAASVWNGGAGAANWACA